MNILNTIASQQAYEIAKSYLNNERLAPGVMIPCVPGCSICTGQKPKLKIGYFVNFNAWWIGVHYSPFNKRFCINVLPFVTFWIVLPNGNIPNKATK